jgi:hypothetical protein
MRVFILVFYLIYIDFKRNYVFSFRPIRSSLKFKNSIFSLFSNSLDKYEKEFEKYRGTPELVDLLENLVLKEPGLEVNITYLHIFENFLEHQIIIYYILRSI